MYGPRGGNLLTLKSISLQQKYHGRSQTLPSMMRDSCVFYTYGLLPNGDYLTLTRKQTAKKQKQKITITWGVNADKC